MSDPAHVRTQQQERARIGSSTSKAAGTVSVRTYPSSGEGAWVYKRARLEITPSARDGLSRRPWSVVASVGEDTCEDQVLDGPASWSKGCDCVIGR